MTTSLRYRSIGLLLSVLSIVACTAPVIPTSAGTTFVIPIPTDSFSKNTALQVAIWDDQQLAALDAQAECVVAHDSTTGADTIHCPAGVEYQEITPEHFVLPIQSVGAKVVVTSTRVQRDAKYQLSISGLSGDDCNSTSAFYEGVANAATITLTDLSWGTTAMACVTTP